MHNKGTRKSHREQCFVQKSRKIFASNRFPSHSSLWKMQKLFYLFVENKSDNSARRRNWRQTELKTILFYLFFLFTFKLNFANCWALNSRSAREADEVHRCQPTDCTFESNAILVRRVPEQRWLISLPPVYFQSKPIARQPNWLSTTGIINLQSDEHSE